MTEIHNNPHLFFSLTPPNSEGNNFDNLAVDKNGIPIGDKTAVNTMLATVLGYSDKDTIGSALEDVAPLASQINIFIANPQLDSDKGITAYFSNIDPKNPTIPPLASLIVQSRESLTQGNIGRSQIPKTPIIHDATQTTENTADSGKEVEKDKKMSHTHIEETKMSHTHIQERRKNPNLGGLAFVAFLIAFATMQRILMRNKEVQGAIEVTSMNMIVSLAESTATLIKEIAKKNQMIHITTAVFAATSLAISLYSAVQVGKYANSGGNKGWDSATASMWSGIGSQLEKFATSVAQASSDMVIAEKEGRKEILQAYRTIAQRQMDKASEAFKASEDMIMQGIQALDKIREGLNQAVAAALRK